MTDTHTASETAKRLRPWLEHNATCPAFMETGPACDCGLADALAHQPPSPSTGEVERIEGGDFALIDVTIGNLVYLDQGSGSGEHVVICTREAALDLAKHLLAALASPSPVQTTPAARWRENGEPDPHGDRFDRERATLCGGHMTDDETANAVYLDPNIANLTAAKERIRWLSRALAKATAPGVADVPDGVAFAGDRLRRMVDGNKIEAAYSDFAHPSATMIADVRKLLAAVPEYKAGEGGK